jgi:RNA polymerase sigma-70 factor (ECF subfamily)
MRRTANGEGARPDEISGELATDAGDTERMERVREGDLALLAELFERHSGRLYGFFLRLTGDRAAAEDLVQEVFVRILKYRKTFRPGARFAPWMWTLARHASADLWRARPRELPEPEDAPEPPSPEAGPLAELERREELDRLSASLERLPAERREILLLARFSGLAYERIGELLGISVGAVKVRVHRAMKDLRSVYQAGESAA